MATLPRATPAYRLGCRPPIPPRRSSRRRAGGRSVRCIHPPSWLVRDNGQAPRGADQKLVRERSTTTCSVPSSRCRSLSTPFHGFRREGPRLQSEHFSYERCGQQEATDSYAWFERDDRPLFSYQQARDEGVI